MNIRVYFLFALVTLFSTANASFPRGYAEIKTIVNDEDAGDPLLLTPLLEANKIDEARAAAEVTYEGFKSVKSYAGYFTVDKVYDSNLFFWFFPSEGDYENDPVVLWLQGGPGSPSIFGLFTENGPFQMKSSDEVELREYSWSKSHSVIYIDSPAGTGFSFTNGGYAQNQTKVGEDLYSALSQFFTLFPNLQKNEFYVTGESYGGKYIPAIAYTIMKKNPDADVKINLQGVAIGDGLIDPINQFTIYSDYLYQLGLIDVNQKAVMVKYEKIIEELIKAENYREAEMIINDEMEYFTDYSGFGNVYNYLYASQPDNGESFMYEFIQSTVIRKAIHVGNKTFGSDQVYENLAEDIPKSIADWVSELLDNYRVVLYSGQFDIILAYPLTLKFLQNFEFSGADEYKVATRYQWYVDNELAGYSKVAGNLTEILVRAAGHMVPTDQPAWAYDLIYRVTRNLPFNETIV